MGHYSYLYINKFDLSWKYHVPNFLAFLFDENDFYEIEVDGSYFKYGYKTNVQRSLERLDENGYTKELFVEVYKIFYKEIFLEYKEWAKEKIGEQLYEYKKDDTFEENTLIELFEDLEVEIKEEEIEYKFEQYINSFAELSKEEEIQDFIEFLSGLLTSQQDYVELNDGNEYEISGEITSRRYRGGSLY